MIHLLIFIAKMVLLVGIMLISIGMVQQYLLMIAWGVVVAFMGLLATLMLWALDDAINGVG